MKRIVMSLGTLVFVAAVVAGGTGAFFSDTETSTGNVFTAGSVTLLLNDITHDGNDAVGFGTTEDETGISFAFDDLKPLDTGTVSFQVLNGANEAYVCARVLDQGGADNTVVNPEADLGDDDTEGELDQFLSFAFDGGVGTIADVDGQWTELVTSPLAPNTPTNSSFDYCFGEFDGSSCVLGAGEYNLAQTDSLSADVEFYAVQTRNNDGFECSSLNEEAVAVTANNLAFDLPTLIANPTSWVFFNDSDNSFMTINQFSAEGGVNDFVTGPAGVEAVQMTLDAATSQPYIDAGRVGQPRYNIATYQFASTALTDIDSLKFRGYDASVSSETPYLHFNVDFDGTDSWQNRLVMVPGASTNPGMPVDTWTEVDAIAGGNAMWCWSGMPPCGGSATEWPTETGVPFADNTAGYQSWDDILAAYPGVALRTADPFFGVRVGHPGPLGEESYVDWIEFDQVTYDFQN